MGGNQMENNFLCWLLTLTCSQGFFSCDRYQVAPCYFSLTKGEDFSLYFYGRKDKNYVMPGLACSMFIDVIKFAVEKWGSIKGY